jgi:NAD(P)H-quinone oxidoreductase subunit I
MLDYFTRIARAATTTFEGMAVTMSWMFRKPSTIQYPFHPSAPHTRLGGPETLPERYRGFLEVDTAVCTACLACERACPIEVISIAVEKVTMPGEAAPVRAMTRFDIDLSKCMFCGLCVEPCPTAAMSPVMSAGIPSRSAISRATSRIAVCSSLRP